MNYGDINNGTNFCGCVRMCVFEIKLDDSLFFYF